MITLPIKRQWFDRIVSGEKREEYREDKPYYQSRFDRYMGNPVQVKFRNGYRKDSPSVVCTVVPHRGTGRPKWGAESNKSYIVLSILEVKYGLEKGSN